MPTGYTWTTYRAAVITQIPTIDSDPNFTTMLPSAIDYAELSIYRDLDLLPAHGTISLGNTTASVATVAVPTGTVVLEALFYGASSFPVIPASQDFIRGVYAGATAGPPETFAVIGAAAGGDWTPSMQVLLGPVPDAVYALNGYGTKRETTLSAAYPSTFISANLPDLFWAASMIFWAGYNRNFGAMADDPRQATSWAAEYQRLLSGAGVEEARRKFQSQGWQAQAPTSIASPRT